MSELPKQVKKQPVEAVKKLLHFLKRQKINQKMVAEKIGKDPSSLSQLIHSKDRSIPKTIEYFRMICAAYEVQVIEDGDTYYFQRPKSLDRQPGDQYFAYAFWSLQHRVGTAALVINFRNKSVQLTFYNENQEEVLLERKGSIVETDRNYVILLGQETQNTNSMILVAHGKVKGVNRHQPPVLLMGTYTGVRFNDHFNLGGRVLLKKAPGRKGMFQLMKEMQQDPQMEALLYQQRLYAPSQSIYDDNMLDKTLKWENRSKDLEGIYYMYHRLDNNKQVSQCLLHIFPGGICQLV
ncbi:MAG: helix-turn-helix transcriptional regulator, partial [Bacteroidota bacterium]